MYKFKINYRFLLHLLTLLVVLVVIVSLGCDEKRGSGLPANPQKWVCGDSQSPFGQEEIEQWCMMNADRGQPAPLELRSPPPLVMLEEQNAYNEDLGRFLTSRTYATELGWKRDLNWRMTGPYVGPIGSGKNFGVHPAVRVYYSPEIIDWLCSGREGPIPDGAMLIKENHNIDESLDISLDNEGCMVIEADVSPDFWTIMVKADGESFDGWYWTCDPTTPIIDRTAVNTEDFFGDTPIPTEPNPRWYPTGQIFPANDDNHFPNVVFPQNEYGNYCINCHASAESQFSFASLENILGPGLRYLGIDLDGDAGERISGHGPGSTTSDLEYISPFVSALSSPDPDFLEFYDQLDEVSFADVFQNRLPGETYDHIVSSADGPSQFLTSDQCIACHDATYLVSNPGVLPNMLLVEEDDVEEKLINLSPYGEWRASPMGMAGRDPIFFSQLQSETNNLPELTTCIENTCLHCHGVMGQRQLAIDTPSADDEGCKELFTIPPPPEVPFGRPFSREMVSQWPGSANSDEQRYGALARDGISCTVCHHISDVGLGDESTYTGNFVSGPADEIYGPYESDTVVPKPMQQGLGITPLFGQQTSGSALCGSCHSILLPVFDNDGNLLQSSYEQTTYLEWLNSDSGRPGPDFRSCQDCHMPTQYKGRELMFNIANIESSAFPPTPNRLPISEIELTNRTKFSRHSLHGLNIFLNEMFQQFPLILGARQIDPMNGTRTVPSMITGRNSMIEMAENETATVEVEVIEKTVDGKLRVVVTVTNKTGHYLPSGVGFRRLFLEFLVRDKDGNVLWASGRTNELGAILEGVTDWVLQSEEPVKFPDEPFQPHYQVIEREDQVQIYQELIKDSEGNLTTSFLRRVTRLKDNRLRPRGFDPDFFAVNPSPFIQELAEIPGEARFDTFYTDPELTGADQIEYLITLDEETMNQVDRVKVTLYNQSIPPFYLQQRFRDANRGPGLKNDIERLHYITSHLNVDAVTDEAGMPVLQSWKLLISSQTLKVK